MTLVLLMSLFQSISDEEITYPPPPHVAAIIQTLPSDPASYERLADEAFAKFANTDEDLSFQRLVDIFRLLVFHDGRSELGLLRIAQLAHEQSKLGDEGVNSLGVLANYYRGSRPSFVSRDELLRRLETYMNNEVLSHNARECRNAVKAKQ